MNGAIISCVGGYFKHCQAQLSPQKRHSANNFCFNTKKGGLRKQEDQASLLTEQKILAGKNQPRYYSISHPLTHFLGNDKVPPSSWGQHISSKLGMPQSDGGSGDSAHHGDGSGFPKTKKEFGPYAIAAGASPFTPLSLRKS